MKLSGQFLEVCRVLVVYYFNPTKVRSFAFGCFAYDAFISQQGNSRNAISSATSGCDDGARIVAFRQDYVLRISGGAPPDSFENVHRMKSQVRITERGV